MKKIIFAVVLVLVLSISVYADKQAITTNGESVILKDDGTWIIKPKDERAKSGYDFRKVNWGMSKLQVKATESGKPRKENHSVLEYEGRVTNKKVFIIYFFTENKLVRAKYSFAEKHSNGNDYITDYKDLKDSLKKKYGKPMITNILWVDDTFKSKQSVWGVAISYGHLMYFSKWETKETDINLLLSGEDFDTELVAEYSSKALNALEDKVREKERANEL